MNLMTFIRILVARWFTIAGIAVLAIAVAAAVIFQTPKSYTATTVLIVDSRGQDPVSGQSLPQRTISGYIATQSDIIRSRNVALKVIEQENLANDPVLQRKFRAARGEDTPTTSWLLSYLNSRVGVAPRRDSTVLDLTFNSQDPALAARLSDAFAKAYLQTNLELRTDPARQVTTWYDQQLTALRETLVDRQNALSTYQEEHGILASPDRLDLETARLNDLSGMLMAVQGERLDHQSRSQQLSASSLTDLPSHVLENPQIQRLSTELAQAQARLTDVGAQLGSNHPQYRQADREVTAARSQLNAALKLIGGNMRSTVQLSQAREEQLKAELDAQKEHVMQLGRIRNELKLLQQEVDNAQTAYDAALARSTQTLLESRSALTDVAILTTASVPSRPTHPKPALTLLLATAFGLLLGTAVALCREWMDRRVRGPEDLEASLGLPVLALIPAERSRWSKRELAS